MRSLERLLEIMTRLRDPQHGCPWDREQTFATIAPHTLEEAYEVADAIQRGDRAALREELGDLLFQVIYHAHMAGEEGAFTFEDVAQELCEKLVRRHPHVFGGTRVESAEAQTQEWEAHKAAERAARAGELGVKAGVLDDLPLALPALLRAHKLQRRAALARLDHAFAPPREALERLEGEAAELKGEASNPSATERLRFALGELLESCVSWARFFGLDCEQALREANARLEHEIRSRERAGARGQPGA
jgi:ATP diphosphatase